MPNKSFLMIMPAPKMGGLDIFQVARAYEEQDDGLTQGGR